MNNCAGCALPAHGVVAVEAAPRAVAARSEAGGATGAELARQVDRIHSIQRPELGTTMNVTTFHGGTVLNVIPELAACDIDIRYTKVLLTLSTHDAGGVTLNDLICAARVEALGG